MLRLVFLVIYLIAACSSAHLQSGSVDWGGGLDPDGLNVPPPGDSGGGWDPNG